MGARFVAALVDHLLQGLLLVALVVPLALIMGYSNVELAPLRTWLLAGAVLALYLVIWGYFIAFEARWNGQTPGKRLAGIRVIRDGGFPIDFRTAMLRNLLRILDMLPTAYGVGLISILASRDYKRLGDYAAGTLVVKETRGRADDPSMAHWMSPAAATPAGPPRYNVSRMTRNEYQAIRHFLDRRQDLPPQVRERLAERLVQPLRERLEPPNEGPLAAPETFLEEVAHAYVQHRRP